MTDSSLTRVQAALLPPLRFAARQDFAGADRLRGFGALVLQVLADVDDDGSFPAGFIDGVKQLASDFDDLSGDPRKARVKFLLQLLQEPAVPKSTSTTTTATAKPQAAPLPDPQPKTPSTPPKPTPKERQQAAVDKALQKGRARRQTAAAQPTNATSTAAKSTAAKQEPLLPPPPREKAAKTATTKKASSRSKRAAVASNDLFTRPASVLRGIGPKKAEALDERGLGTIGALLSFLPRTYQDRSKPQKLGELQMGSQSVATGVIAVSAQVGHGSRSRWEILLEDDTGSVRLVFFRYRPHDMRRRFVPGERLTALGEVTRRGGGLQMVHPRLNPRGAEAAAGIHPVYPEILGMPAQDIGKAVRAAAELVQARPVDDLLPEHVRRLANVMELNAALQLLHTPPAKMSPEQLDALITRKSAAHLRLAFEELFVLQLALCLRQQQSQAVQAAALPSAQSATDNAERDALIVSMQERLLPWTLTGAQRRATGEIFADMGRAAPMGRLLQGDVGAGKTAVAALACLLCADDKQQAALMAPTEILAEQHASTLRKWFSPLGYRVELLTGSVRGKQRKLLLAKLKNREIDVLVGTHALVQDDVEFRRLGLCIIDEQHRFGVEQRAALKAKGPVDDDGQPIVPHLLVMTATPIPRSLALTVYGELAVSVLDELPPGRSPVDTKVLTAASEEHAYVAVQKAIAQGERAYVVYPLIEESEALDLEDATRGHDDLCERFGADHVELLHGRMSGDEKDAIMQRFASGEVSVLVSTTVIEVGVDVPEATVMIIVNAERFGLSQLHQLRGRVGRSHRKSRCFLLLGKEGGGKDAVQRLRIMEETGDGFRIAEEDLLIRGPGDFLGTRQSGLPTLQFASLADHQALVEKARQQALAFVEDDPQLQRPEHRPLRRLVFERYQERLALAGAG